MAMDWLMLEGHNDEGTIHTLGRRGVLVREVAINSPVSATGIAFDSRELSTVLDALGYSYMTPRFRRLQTNLNRVSLLSDSSTPVVPSPLFPGEERVRFSGTIRESQRAILASVAEKFSDIFGKKIFIRLSSSGEFNAPVIDDEVIFVWAEALPSIDGSESSIYREVPAEIFGVALREEQRAAHVNLSGGYSGTTITDDNGAVVGEFLGNNLYIHFRAFALGATQNIAELFEKLLEAYAIASLKDEDLRAKFEEAQALAANREMEEARANYIAECGKRVGVRKESLARSVATAKVSSEEAHRTLVALIRKVSQLEAELKAIDRVNGDDTGKFDAEFTNLLNTPGVEKVLMREGYVDVYTHHVTIEHRGGVYDIGKFRIEISTEGRNGGVHCYNLTREVSNGGSRFQHPHVEASGGCCLGNIGNGIFDLIANYEFAVVAQIMIQYLGTYNPDDPYCRIGAWPLVEDVDREVV